jgi:sulfoxide reductase heme-binding subunit YedZ
VFPFLEKLLRSKLFVSVVVVLPGLWPVVPFFVTGNATILADPPKYLLHHVGFTASCVLMAVLTFSPLRILFPKSRLALALNRHRRFVGVTAFVYAALHVTMHFIYEGGFDTFATDWKKPFIAVGLVAFTILAVLAATSPHAMVRLIGGRRWKGLHRLVYVAAVLVVYHQISARKVFPMQVVWIFGPLLALELWRIARALARKRQLFS